ncbi:MAG: hypothetical protein C0622_07005 [Desulfuromonas sp.]|nr:MAG: hypothetical protein C0622_07005 [Desulfuromonas sp.]
MLHAAYLENSVTPIAKHKDMRTILLLICLLVPCWSFAHAEELPTPEHVADFVLNCDTLDQLKKTHDINASKAASCLFNALPYATKNDQIWEALLKLRCWFDGAAHEEYGDMAHAVFTEHPRVFYTRFLAGDSRAIILTQDSFIPGTWTANESLEEENRLTPIILGALEKAVMGLKAIRPPSYEYDQRALHDAYMARTEALLKEWPVLRENLLLSIQK